MVDIQYLMKEEKNDDFCIFTVNSKGELCVNFIYKKESVFSHPVNGVCEISGNSLIITVCK